MVANEIAALISAKQHDYGHGNILAFGEEGVLVRTSDKWERLKHLYSKRSGEGLVEPLEDAWMDLAGYAIIALMLRRGWFTLELDESWWTQKEEGSNGDSRSTEGGQSH